MMDSPRNGKPYVWVTWITGLLSGMDKCQWRAWYRSHYRYAKLARTSGELDAWMAEHDKMTETRVAELRAYGLSVSIENANSFQLHGKGSILAGKPDIVATKGDQVLIIDEKSGSPKPSDEWQVLLYMFALPLVGAVRQMDGNIAGQVEYRGSRVPVLSSHLDAAAKDRIVSTLKMIGEPVSPARTPSQKECAVCDIASCPERIETAAVLAATEEF